MTDPFDRPARPWDLFNRNLGRVGEVVAKERIAICEECPLFIQSSRICGDCKCFMDLKTKLPNAECPQHKWGQVKVGFQETEG